MNRENESQDVENNEFESMNSQDIIDVFGSDVNSQKESNSQKKDNKINKKLNDINNDFDSSKTKLINEFPLSSIVNFPSLNKVQNECFDLLYKTNKSTLITAPTGSGKTLLFELAIARVIKLNYDINSKSYLNKNFKIIYIAPIKSLCQEKTYDWKIKFTKPPLELKVMEYTSDSEYLNMTLLNSSNIILTTPEKFDVLSRKWKDISNFISNISLILFDEIHLLNEETRVTTLKAVITRIKLVKSM